MKKRNKLIFTLGCAFVATLCMGVTAQFNNVYAEGEEFTLDDVTYTMMDGAAIYKNPDKLGIRFGATMSKDDYNKLSEKYDTVTYGVVIAPNSYADLNETTLFGVGGEKVFDWAVWENGEWKYDDESPYTRVINIESSALKLNKAGTEYNCYGAITTLQAHNLLTEFKATSYIAVGTGSDVEYKFATPANDGVRTPVYVAQAIQQKIKNNDVADDEMLSAMTEQERQTLSETLGEKYLTTDVTAKNATYTVEHYYAKPNGGYFLYESETKTGAINSVISTNSYTSEIEGVTFDSADADAVVYAQNKSVVKAYYDVDYSADADGEETVFDLNTTETDYTVDSGIQAVYNADMQKISDNEVIEKSAIVGMGKGEHDLYVLTEDGFAKYAAIMATHVISTADQLVDFFNSYSGKENITNTWYVVLSNDIDYTSTDKTLNEKVAAQDYFRGTFNGLGHNVSNITGIPTQGLFGYTYNGSMIKNVALTNVVAGTDYILSGQVEGSVNNVYIQGSCSIWAERGPLKITSISSLSNVIINVTSSSAGILLDKGNPSGSASKISSSYVIGANAYAGTTAWSANDTGVYADTTYAPESSKVYASLEELAADDGFVADITNNDDWSKYWRKTAIGLYFGDLLLAQNPNIEVDETKETKYLNVVEVGTTGAVSETKTHEINLKEMLGQTPETVLIDGVEIPATDTLTLNSADYEDAYGTEHSIIFGAGETVIEQPFIFATHVITTADEFVDFFNSYSGSASNTKPTYNGTDTWYAIVATDIDLTNISSGKEFTAKEMSDYYGGKFNGLGHVISNLKVKGDHGLFGYTAKYVGIYNLALVNVTAGSKSVLTNYLNQYGVASNIYIQGTGSSSGTRGAMKVAGGTISNCIVNMTTQQYGYTYNDNWGTITKSYAVCTTKFSNHSTTPGTPHTDMTALLSDTTFITDIKAGSANGWSEYWHLTGDATSGYTLTFGAETKVIL